MKDILKNELYVSDIGKIIEKYDLSAFRNQTILITGGLGLICSSVVDILIEYNKKNNAGIHIYVADINSDFYGLRYGNCSCVNYVYYDAVRSLKFNFNADYIIHGAGLASPELYVEKPVETMLSNFNGALTLLEYARNCQTKRLLYVSSSEVYGNKIEPGAFNENGFGVVDINAIRSSYAEAKRASEILCKSYSAEYNVDTVIVRPGHVYGPTASPSDNRVSSVFAYRAARGEDLEMKSSGIQKRSYCYSLDCAAAILVALLKGEKGESYNIGHNEETSIWDMADILARAGNVSLSVDAPSEEELKRFNPMSHSTLNNDKIKNIGYEDCFTVEEGLTHTVQILKNII